MTAFVHPGAATRKPTTPMATNRAALQSTRCGMPTTNRSPTVDVLIQPPQRVSVMVVKQIDDCFAAWNEPQTEQRRAVLERSLTAHVELVHPTRAFARDRRVAGRY